MGERHVERLFSEAYDRRLDDAERRRFEEHLAACDQCRQQYAWYRSTVDSVRALPAARMPVPVVLPASPPAMEPGPGGRWRTLVEAALRPRSLAAAGVLAAGGLAAVVVAVHLSHGGTSTATSLNAAGGAAQKYAGAAPACPIRPFAVAAPPGQAATTPPEGFAANSVQAAAGQGQTLVLATRAHSYHPGDTVLVYARLVGPAPASTAIVPCVSLVRGEVVAAKGLEQTGPAAGSVRGAPAAPLATAEATDVNSPAAPLLKLVIPADVLPGTTLTLVATVPSGTTANPLTAQLTITVT